MSRVMRIDAGFDKLIRQLKQNIQRDTGLEIPDSELTRLVAAHATFMKKNGRPKRTSMWDIGA